MPENLFKHDPTDTRDISEARERVLSTMNAAGILPVFDIRITIPDEYVVRCTIDPVRPEFRGGMRGNAVNGGVLAALFDLALGLPGWTRQLDAVSGTMHLSINYMRAVRGTRVVAEGWIERGGKGVLFTAARILDEKDQVCATATGLVRVLGA